ILFDVEFSEPVTGFATGDVVLSGTAGATTATVSGSGTTYTVAVSGIDRKSVVEGKSAARGATGAGTNNKIASTSTDTAVTFAETADTTPPTVTIVEERVQVDPTSNSPVLFDVVFSEPVTGFATGDVVLSGTAGATTATVSGSGTTYTVAVSGMTSDGTVVASVPAGVATDAAGNAKIGCTKID